MKKMLLATLILSSSTPIYSSLAVERDIVQLGRCSVTKGFGKIGKKIAAKRCAKQRAKDNVTSVCHGKILGSFNTSFRSCTEEYSLTWPYKYLGEECEYSATATCDSIEGQNGNQAGGNSTGGGPRKIVSDSEITYASGCYVEETYAAIGKGMIGFEYSVKETVREYINNKVDVYTRMQDKIFWKNISVGKTYMEEEELVKKLMESCNEIRSGMIEQLNK